MYITKIFTFAAGHRLFNYDGDCANIHGHNYKVEVTIIGKVGATGMVIDFKELGRQCKNVLDKYDHALILCKGDPLIDILNLFFPPAHFQNIPRIIPCVGKIKIHIMEGNPTAENMATEIACLLFKDEIPVYKVKLYETETSFAEVKLDSIAE